MNRIILFDLTGRHRLIDAVCKQINKPNKDVAYIAHCAKCPTLQGGAFIPLFFCYSYDEMRAHGFNVPREFVYEVGVNPNPDYIDDPKNQPEMLCEIVGDSLKKRIKSLQALCADKVKLLDVRDWCVGAFRRYLFMDDDVHGTAGIFSPLELLKDRANLEDRVKYCERWFWGTSDENRTNREMLRARFGVAAESNGEKENVGPKATDPLRNYKDVLSVVFKSEYEDFKEILSDVTRDLERATSFFDISDSGFLTQKGLALKFVSPSGKIRVLVVDDNADDEIAKFTEEDDIKIPFDFTPLQLKKNEDESSSDFIKRAVGRIKKTSKENFDVILLDLSLGETSGSDLSGYHLIRRFKQWMPTAHIIIYSAHDDMGRIARAFCEGANWFLKKSEAREKLARHFISLMANRNWKKEYGVIRSKYVLDINGKDKNFLSKFRAKETWQYLTIKCLESLPGHYIKINIMGGGISTAVTFRAQKGVTRDTEDNQAPVIIKIDSVFNTRMEYERYFRFIRPYIANESGRVENRESVLNRDNAAIVYTFAGRRDSAHELNTLDELLRCDLMSRETCDYEKYRKIFDALFDEIIPRLHRVTPIAEFRDAKEAPTALSEFSDYPNRTFGELECGVDSTEYCGNNSWFFSNYTYRMPIEFICSQFKLTTDDDGETGIGGKVVVLEVYGVQKDKDKPDVLAEYPYAHLIECQRYNEEYKWHDKILLKGDMASYYVRFRKHLWPGMALKMTEDNLREESEVMTWCCKKFKIQAKEVKGGTNTAWLKISRGFFEFIENLMMDDAYKNKPLIMVRDILKHLVDKAPQRFICPVGIVHGDLNLKNIMIESRVNQPKGIHADISKILSDVWLIDFARTRRDVVAHDFNVAFTSVLPLLFQPDLVGSHKKEMSEEQRKYVGDLDDKLEPFLRHVLFDENDTLADVFLDDQRLVFMYKILRRIRRAALSAGVSEDMYLLTTALSCLYSFKLYLKQEMPEAATALVMAGLLCVERLNPLRSKKNGGKA